MDDQFAYTTTPQLHANTPPYIGTTPIPNEIQQLAKDVNSLLKDKMNSIHPNHPQSGRKWLANSGKPWSTHFTKYGWIKTDSTLFRHWMDTRIFSPWVWRNLATSNVEGKSTKHITFFAKDSKKIEPDCSMLEPPDSWETATITETSASDVSVDDATETMDSSDTSMTETSAMDTSDNHLEITDQVDTSRRRSERIEHQDLNDDDDVKWFFKCRGCGLSGENVGEGSGPAMCCDKCKTWQHFHCAQELGIVDSELGLRDIAEQGFVCESCR
ncbi:hypothetical protein AC578_9417 [Pseudocercospora eumusae]|uniref:Zinc finger PHD-type domain-containing protein n=1 Tax=Pseudocercospora eumusae TaxID=321146 RepID=A0A139H6W4_9PEZI|nr:hypothetical protein AC578_9417 [Pseudocercospora eumusae]